MQLCCGICWCEWICPSQLLWLSFLEKILRTIPPNKASESWRNDLSRHVSKSFIIRRHLWIYQNIYMPVQAKALQWAIQNPNFMGWSNTNMTIYTICPASQTHHEFSDQRKLLQNPPPWIFSNTETRWSSFWESPPDLQKIPLGATWLAAQLLPPQLNQLIPWRAGRELFPETKTHVCFFRNFLRNRFGISYRKLQYK